MHLSRLLVTKSPTVSVGSPYPQPAIERSETEIRPTARISKGSENIGRDTGTKGRPPLSRWLHLQVTGMLPPVIAEMSRIES